MSSEFCHVSHVMSEGDGRYVGAREGRRKIEEGRGKKGDGGGVSGEG